MLKNIEIVNYKCFKDFKLNGLSQINIISGGNNVGKTALLEALLIINNENIRSIIDIIKLIFLNRDLSIENINNYLKKINLSFKKDNKIITIQHKYIDELINSNIKNFDNLKGVSEEFLLLTIDNKLFVFPLKEQEELSSRKIIDIKKEFNFIDSASPNNKLLVELYSEVQTKNIQHNFLEYLKILDDNIVLLEPQFLYGEPLVRITLKNPELSLISSELGEGTNRYIEILATLLSNSNGSVFIDEIENGIHYSKLKEICKAIIEIVEKEDIQLFITTHDEETIEAFAQASEELNYKGISSIELYKDEDNTIQSIVRNSEQFIATVDAGMEVR
ncbi:MAG: AAA family ATPase [Campylobacterota bacterium]|nr:AAA family ATPase [Campylobacterota bacterium]